MKAKDVMTSPVVSVEQDTPVLQAIRIMMQKRISGLPVVDKSSHLIGIVTESDFLRRAETGTQRRRARWLEFLVGPGRLADEYTRSHGSKVGEVMTPDPVSVTEDTPLDGDREADGEAPHQARAGGPRRVRGRHHQPRQSAARPGDRCRTGSRASSRPTRRSARCCSPSCEKQPWAPVALINPIVRDGVVDLWGTITDERERKALVVAAENVPGREGRA